MPSPAFPARLWTAFRGWWREQCSQKGVGGSVAFLARELWGFLRDSTPERKRQRYGDMEYDWEHRVNTTSGSVGWRERLLGVLHSPYQPTDPAVFHEMIASLPIDLSQFTFVDIGSGKGRTLLMASEYPFRKVVGVEILPELDAVAQQNIRGYKSPTQRCADTESICADASEFPLPETPLVLYLFNPLPAGALDRLLANAHASLQQSPRTVFVLYHNPLLQERLRRCTWLSEVRSAPQFVVFQSSG